MKTVAKGVRYSRHLDRKQPSDIAWALTWAEEFVGRDCRAFPCVESQFGFIVDPQSRSSRNRLSGIDEISMSVLPVPDINHFIMNRLKRGKTEIRYVLELGGQRT